MTEPQKYSMATGLPVKEKVKSYPLKSNEQEFWNFIAEHEQARRDWRKEQNDEDNKEGD